MGIGTGAAGACSPRSRRAGRPRRRRLLATHPRACSTRSRASARMISAGIRDEVDLVLGGGVVQAYRRCRQSLIMLAELLRPVRSLSRCAKRYENIREVVAAEVANEPEGSWASNGVSRARSCTVGADQAALPGPARRRRRTMPGTPGSACRRCAVASVSPPGSSYASRSLVPVLEDLTCQPCSRNTSRELCRARIARMTRSSDWRLKSTIHVDVAEVAARRVGDRLPHVALVQLGVADQRDEPPPVARAEVRRARSGRRRRRRAARRHRGPPTRSRSRRVGILRPARVRLQPAEVAQPRRAASGRAGPAGSRRRAARARRAASPTRGHRRAASGARQGRHDGDERRRRRLVAADLEAVPLGALAVGEVDHPRREPEHAALDLLQRREVGSGREGGCRGRQAGRRRSCAHSGCLELFMPTLLNSSCFQ